MANEPLGNNAWEGVLGVVRITFNGVSLGKTTADTEITIDQDIKDIIFQQGGTKYSDKVRTGVAHQVTCVFGEIDTALLEQLHKGWEKSTTENSMKLGRSLYQSWKTAEAKVLKLTRVDSEGNASTDPRHQIVFYKAAPEITGPVMWGADTQRNVPVTFHIFFDDTESAFGYSGFASSVGLTPAA